MMCVCMYIHTYHQGMDGVEGRVSHEASGQQMGRTGPGFLIDVFAAINVAVLPNVTGLMCWSRLSVRETGGVELP